jgi:hypothetical protein
MYLKCCCVKRVIPKCAPDVVMEFKTLGVSTISVYCTNTVKPKSTVNVLTNSSLQQQQSVFILFEMVLPEICCEDGSWMLWTLFNDFGLKNVIFALLSPCIVNDYNLLVQAYVLVKYVHLLALRNCNKNVDHFFCSLLNKQSCVDFSNHF